MTAATARFATDKASQYLQQLCRHFAHKVEARFDETRAEIDFEPGTCVLEAGNDGLALACTTETQQDVQRLIHILEIHLIRFAWREEVILDWHDEAGAPVTLSVEVAGLLATERETFAAKRSK